MNSILHEVGWRNALYCLFVGLISLSSLVTLLRQTTKEHQARIKAELSMSIRAERGEADPADVLRTPPPKSTNLLPRILLIIAHGLVILSSIYLGRSAIISASYAHQANTAVVAHDYERAVKLYTSALEADQFAGFLNTQFQSAIAQRDAQGGDLGQMRRLVNLHPGNEGNHNDLGNELMRHGDLTNAIKEYRQAMMLKPDDAIVHNNLGNALQADHQYAESVAELRKAIQLDPNQIPTYYNLANTLVANGQTDEAIKYYRIAIEKNPKLAPAYYNLAQALAKQGKREDAIVAMDTFLQLAPNQPAFAGSVDKAKAQLAQWRNTP